MITPAAPALNAFVALIANEQVPRLIRAMLPAGNPAKSAGLQPVIADTVLTEAVTSPLPEYDMTLFTIGPVGGGDTC